MIRFVLTLLYVVVLHGGRRFASIQYVIVVHTNEQHSYCFLCLKYLFPLQRLISVASEDSHNAAAKWSQVVLPLLNTETSGRTESLNHFSHKEAVTE